MFHGKRAILVKLWLYIGFFFVLFFVLSSGCKSGKTKKETVFVDQQTPEQPPTIPPPLPPGQTPEVPPPVARGPDFISFAAFETAVLNDLSNLPEQDRLDARYLVLSDKFNEGDPRLEAYGDSLAKGINQLSLERDLYYSDVVLESGESIYRLDIDEIGLTRSEWRLIESNDPFKFESFTARGLLIKQLTQARRPWIHANNFMTIAHNDDVYYEIMDVPANLNTFYNFLGVDIQQQFDDVDEDLYLMGFFGSAISLQKNRMLIRLDSRDGKLWGTYDTVLENVVSGPRNLFENPFPFEARTARVFGHDAQEFIYTLPNGLHGYALFNAAGVRENFAPTNIVIDVNANGLDPTIRNSLSCMRCHSNGIIEATDQIAEHVDGNPDFNNLDQQVSEAFFGKSGASAAFGQDNKNYCDSLQRIGISCADRDPVNGLTDSFRKEWDLKQTASFFFMDEDEFATALNGSAQGRAQIGQLLSGGLVSLQQIIQTTPILIEDFNLFQDDLGE